MADGLTHIGITRIARIRRKLRRLAIYPERWERPWAKHTEWPMNAFAEFEHLRLRDGLTLRLYTWCGGIGGHGWLWAAPEESPFPDPEDLIPTDERNYAQTPRPPGALDDFRSAIEGDASAWSYFAASLFAREGWEMGAFWHSLQWSVESVLGGDPWEKQLYDKSAISLPSPRENWSWRAPEPTDWRAAVHLTGTPEVRFYSYATAGQETIYLNVDRYTAGDMTFESERVEVATGPGVVIF